MNAAEHLVIGGGLAGSMAALRLAAAGREVTLLERERTPHHKVCGEFLSPESVAYLAQAGVDPLGLGAKTIRFLRLTSKKHIVESELPFTALSLSRCVLDEALLMRAAEAGCRVERGAFVEGLDQRGDEWHAQLRGGEAWRAAAVFLASGKHDVRGLERKPGLQGDLVGFKLHWRLAPAQTAAIDEFMDLYLFRGGYGGLSLVEGEAANLCLVVRRSVLRSSGGWSELLAGILSENPHLTRRLDGATPLWARPLAVSSIPYGYVAAGGNGLWCIGDQAAVIPSFTGDGMSIALHSASLAVQMYLAGASPELYQQTLRAELRRGMGIATALSRAMVTGAGRIVAPIGLALVPAAMRWIADATRIPTRALLPAREVTLQNRDSARI